MRLRGVLTHRRPAARRRRFLRRPDAARRVDRRAVALASRVASSRPRACCTHRRTTSTSRSAATGRDLPPSSTACCPSGSSRGSAGSWSGTRRPLRAGAQHPPPSVLARRPEPRRRSALRRDEERPIHSRLRRGLRPLGGVGSRPARGCVRRQLRRSQPRWLDLGRGHPGQSDPLRHENPQRRGPVLSGHSAPVYKLAYSHMVGSWRHRPRTALSASGTAAPGPSCTSSPGVGPSVWPSPRTTAGCSPPAARGWSRPGTSPAAAGTWSWARTPARRMRRTPSPFRRPTAVRWHASGRAGCGSTTP